MPKEKEYEIGYGKPPKKTQFKPGQSGNPKGRPKGTKNLATDLTEELSQKISINEGGKQQRVSKQRALVKSLLSKALKGDIKAVGMLIQLVQQVESKAPNSSSCEPLSKADMELLKIYFSSNNS